MHRRLYSFLETQNCFYPAQFGFRLNLSTNNTLMSITENIQTQLHEGKHSTRVFVDLKIVFDTVDHNILLGKLDNCGIRGITNKWFCSYLKKRKYFVSIEYWTLSSLSSKCHSPQPIPTITQSPLKLSWNPSNLL